MVCQMLSKAFLNIVHTPAEQRLRWKKCYQTFDTNFKIKLDCILLIKEREAILALIQYQL